MQDARGRANPAQAHQRSDALVIPCPRRDVTVVLIDALIQPIDLTEKIADDGVGPSEQSLQVTLALVRTVLALSGSTMPYSLSRPRMRLSVAVRAST